MFFKIYKCEGAKTFFRGYGATVIGVVPYAGMSFFTYETLKKEYAGKFVIGLSNISFTNFSFQPIFVISYFLIFGRPSVSFYFLQIISVVSWIGCPFDNHVNV